MPPPPSPSTHTHTHTFTLEESLYRALNTFRALAVQEPCRELSLIVTKLEEAVLWNDARRAKLGLDLLGLDYTP